MFVKQETVNSVQVAPGMERKVMARGGALMSSEVIFKKGAVGALHTHPHEQIGCILSGSFEVEIEGNKEILKKGDTYYVPSNAPHGVVALEDSVILDVFTPQREDFLK